MVAKELESLKMELSCVEGQEFESRWSALVGNGEVFGDPVDLVWIGDKSTYFHGAWTGGALEWIEFEDTFHAPGPRGA